MCVCIEVCISHKVMLINLLNGVVNGDIASREYYISTEHQMQFEYAYIYICIHLPVPNECTLKDLIQIH